MDFSRTAVDGVYLLRSESLEDSRGSFQRLWCQRAAEANGLSRPIVQVSLSETRRERTLRGMHFQIAPSREEKIVRCLVGSIFDVALDLRPRSRTYLRHFGTVLSGEDQQALLIPAGCAHGHLTLTRNCAVLYMMTDYYEPELSRGVRWNDPAFAIEWPSTPHEILPRDADYPDFEPRIVDGFADY